MFGWKWLIGFILCLIYLQQPLASQPIDRYALVQRHTVINNTFDSLSALTIGNGKFACTVDFTGLQTFPDAYAQGIPLGTQSEWAWHSFTNPQHYRRSEAVMAKTGTTLPDSLEERREGAWDYYTRNPHRLQLGNIGFDILKKDGSPAGWQDVHPVQQQLNLWTGEIKSLFSVEDEPVEVSTIASQNRDLLTVQVRSPLLKEGRLRVRIHFPYPTGKPGDGGNNWQAAASHISFIKVQQPQSIQLMHVLDTNYYFMHVAWEQPASVLKLRSHYYQLLPGNTDSFSVSCAFTPQLLQDSLPAYAITAQNTAAAWKKFWLSGAAVDFTGSTDARALELERRIVLSQYLLRVQCAGNYPPQAAGLTYNETYGKPEPAMQTWMQAQYALWNRTSLLEPSLQWYTAVAAKAAEAAVKMHRNGVRWPAIADADGEGMDVPDSLQPMQRPQFIYLAELCYRRTPDSITLQRYKDLVFATAAYLADVAAYDSVKKVYTLGKGTRLTNSALQLCWWRWALQTAQQWRERCGLPRNNYWDKIIQHLAPLPVQDGVYLLAENIPGTYTDEQYRRGDPALLQAAALLPPAAGADSLTMRHTFNWIWYNWYWEQSHGYNFPLAAMAATRMNMPERAVEALFMSFDTNRWLPNGHNYEGDRARISLPGNGAFLQALALMCAGYDGCTIHNPGFPQNSGWKLRWEGLQRLP